MSIETFAQARPEGLPQGPLYVMELGGQVLALTADEFAAASERGRALNGQTERDAGRAGPLQGIVDADRMEELTGVPATWFLEMARKGKVPHLRFGKYVRFSPDEVFSSRLYKERSGR